MTAKVLDVAAAIIRDREIDGGSLWTIHRLCYYAQGWSMVWHGQPLFEETIEAWASGPVIPALYELHKGYFRFEDLKGGDPNNLTEDQRDEIANLTASFMHMHAHDISEKARLEPPCVLARIGLSETERGNRVITPEALLAYFCTL